MLFERGGFIDYIICFEPAVLQGKSFNIKTLPADRRLLDNVVGRCFKKLFTLLHHVYLFEYLYLTFYLNIESHFSHIHSRSKLLLQKPYINCA